MDLKSILVKILRHNKSVRYSLLGYLRPLPRRPIIVLGNQKSGTSAIAALLGQRTGVSYSIDLKHEIKDPIFYHIYSGQLDLTMLINRNRLDFTRKIIKERNLTLLYNQLYSRFPRAQVVMVVRDPFDNLRSILDRLSLPGNLSKLSSNEVASLGPAWRAIIFNYGLNIEAENYISHMAKRWKMIAELYLRHKSNITLLRYEDFVKDKQKSIDSLARTLELDIKSDISHLLDIQFQRRGTPIDDFEAYFGSANYREIANICRRELVALGYER